MDITKEAVEGDITTEVSACVCGFEFLGLVAITQIAPERMYTVCMVVLTVLVWQG